MFYWLFFWGYNDFYMLCLRFHERGRAFSRNEVRAFEIGPDELFFTGDGMGELKVWKLATQTP